MILYNLISYYIRGSQLPSFPPSAVSKAASLLVPFVVSGRSPMEAEASGRSQQAPAMGPGNSWLPFFFASLFFLKGFVSVVHGIYPLVNQQWISSSEHGDFPYTYVSLPEGILSGLTFCRYVHGNRKMVSVAFEYWLANTFSSFLSTCVYNHTIMFPPWCSCFGKLKSSS